MTVKELKEIYGTGKTLSSLKEWDFAKYCNLEEVVYKGVQIRIEQDRYNDIWLYSSDEIPLSGRYCGTLTELKRYLKSKINSNN